MSKGTASIILLMKVLNYEVGSRGVGDVLEATGVGLYELIPE